MEDQIIAERYQIMESRSTDKLLYRALDLTTNDDVLIEIFEEVEWGERWRDFFDSIVSVINKLNHPNIIHILDHGIEDDLAYLVTEYAPYQTLKEILNMQPQMPLDVVLKHGLEMADALARLHYVDVIHGNIHPNSIWVFEDGVRIARFELAEYEPLEGTVIGTPVYISPEAAHGETATTARDIWSFGVVLFEMLTGQIPFKAPLPDDDSEENIRALLLSIVNDPLPDIATLQPDLPSRLVMLINRLLEKDPEKRIRSMRQVAAELETITHDLKNGHLIPPMATPLALGQLIGERYQLEEEIGRGAFGYVYRAFDLRTGQVVAIKQLRESVAASAEHLERFHRESQALQMLKHPGILKILDTVETKDEHFLVLEYIEGGNLRQLLNNEALSLRQLLEIALELADALARAHHVNIIHRDIKPENILIAADGSPRLSDFGVARMESQDRLTMTGHIVGTIDYIAPEVLHGQMASHLADIWSFGIMLYEMLTGERPFQGEIMTQILIAILSAPLPDLKATCPELPDELMGLIYAMLQRDPLDRLNSMREVATQLERVLNDLDD